MHGRARIIKDSSVDFVPCFVAFEANSSAYAFRRHSAYQSSLYYRVGVPVSRLSCP